jgi:Toastrack DUF4097
MTEEKFEQAFQVSAPAQLTVKNVRGMVEIHPGDDGTIQVTAIKHTDTGDADLTEIEMKQELDGSVQAAARFPEGSLDWLFGKKPCKVDFIITAPHQCSLKVSGVSNDAVISGFEGDFRFNSVSGDLNLRELTGEVSISMVSGDVELESINGSLKLHTVSGDVDGKKLSGKVELDAVSGDLYFKDSNLPAVEARTVSGKVELQTPLGEGPYRFGSVSGDVRMNIPLDTHCSVELHSLSGRISTSLNKTSALRDRGSEMVDVQGGGMKIQMHSVSGKLSLDAH